MDDEWKRATRETGQPVCAAINPRDALSGAA